MYIYIYIYIFSGRGFKSCSGHIFIATPKNPAVVNAISVSSVHHAHAIICGIFQLKQTWPLTNAIAEIKSEEITKNQIEVVAQSLLRVQVELLTIPQW